MQTFDKIKIDLKELDGVVFDMDGVITDTAITHARAWKRLFDEYLQKHAAEHGEQFRPFDIDADYRLYVDGKPRYDGVHSFLDSRGISLPYGDPSDSPDRDSICGLGNRKNGYFNQQLENEGVRTYESSVAFIKLLKKNGKKTAIISASRNAEAVLQAGGVRELFDVKVDGVVSDELGLKGKPDPAIFLEAASQLGILPERAAVVEDALAGVQAGQRGKFKLVIGVDRTGHADDLKNQGADVVVNDLGELLPAET
jgi:trehalose 6-phosphate phosphatase